MSGKVDKGNIVHARSGQCLADHLDLLRRGDFARPHGGLEFGPEVRTPAMQAGLVDSKLTFRDVVTAVATFFPFLALLTRVRCWRQALISRCAAAWQQSLTEARSAEQPDQEARMRGTGAPVRAGLPQPRPIVIAVAVVVLIGIGVAVTALWPGVVAPSAGPTGDKPPTAARAAVAFEQVEYAIEPLPMDIAIGDINGDGRVDIATAHAPTGVCLLYGQEAGEFHPAYIHHLRVGEVLVIKLATADIDGSGKLALLLACPNENAVVVARAQPSGALSETYYTTGQGPAGIATADFNRDGKLDVATANSQDGTISVLYGQGGGLLGGRRDYEAGGNPWSIAAADFNGDTWPDLAVADDAGNRVTILHGRSGGELQRADEYPIPKGLRHPVALAADLNGDALPDLAVSGEKVSVLYALPQGGFEQQDCDPQGWKHRRPEGLAAGDIDGDGLVDLVASSRAKGSPPSSSMCVLYSQPDGQFKTVEYPVGRHRCGSVATADFNGDGRLDVAVTTWVGLKEGYVSVFLNQGK